MTATALVLFMTLPGLALFYAGLVRQKNALDVCAVYGIGGVLGSLLVAIFASKAFGGAGYAAGGSMASQLGPQLIAIVAAPAWSALGTLAILAATAKLCGLHADEQARVDGLDVAHHGERALPILSRPGTTSVRPRFRGIS